MTKKHLNNTFKKLDFTNSDYPEEFFHFLRIVEMGAKKYARNNWLEPDGTKTDEKSMHDSMFHHLAKSFANPKSVDEDSQQDNLLSLICRAAMLYTRRQRGIVNPKDQSSADLVRELRDHDDRVERLQSLWDEESVVSICRIPNCEDCAATRLPKERVGIRTDNVTGDNCISMEQHFENLKKRGGGFCRLGEDDE